MKQNNKQQLSLLKSMRIAVVHDFLLYRGGAEKVLLDIMKLFPDAPIYTLLYDEVKMKDVFGSYDINTSFLQRGASVVQNHHKWLLPFYGAAIESFDLRDFDLVISSSGAWSKGIVTRLNTKHVAYIHSPMRYVWDENEYYLKKNTNIKHGLCVRTFLSYLRVWDHQAAQRPDVLIANSLHTQKRIQKYYRREANVVYPGVNINKKYNKLKKISKKDSYFLIISRLSPYKNVALAIEVCNKLQLPLVVVGEGKEEKKLRKMAGPTIKIVGWVDEEKKNEYLLNARALLFPSEDDFGLVCIEAMQCGIPVIALNRGGASETVIENVTGELFELPTIEMMADAIRRFLINEKKYNKQDIEKQGQKYNINTFERDFLNVIYNIVK